MTYTFKTHNQSIINTYTILIISMFKKDSFKTQNKVWTILKSSYSK